ncbi:MAG: DUF748 domain-containing protein, partial [Burkholderiales bacterium]|nr:DUF748 domain-containing protein [Burkholderiales bacterium]
PPGPPLPIDVSIGSTQLVNARIDFTDHFIQPHYSAALTQLSGELGRFDSNSRDMATVQLSGRAEGTGLLQVSGLVNPLVRPIALDIKASATDLDLAPLSPYAGKYAGYGIERGKLTMKLAYKIDAGGKLVASNQVILNQLTFGDKVDSPSATKLPVRLAVALLKDRNGVIDINLPISGTLSDPQFSVGGIIVRLIVNLIVKAVTSPFALLTGGGSGGADQGFVAFDPGSAALGAAAAAQIEKVAKALADKTSLQMTIVGSADAAVEGPAFQQAEIEARLRAAHRRELLDQGADASAADAALSPEDHARLLARLYAATKFPDKPAKAPAPEAMQALLAQHATVSADAMNQLALQRATAVRDALITQGVDSSRLFLAAPKVLAGAQPDWSPRAQLELSVP